jgi:hypothetical protein
LWSMVRRLAVDGVWGSGGRRCGDLRGRAAFDVAARGVGGIKWTLSVDEVALNVEDVEVPCAVRFLGRRWLWVAVCASD